MFTGGCYCGAIRYQVSDRIFDETNCHCDMCRKTTGAPAVAWFSVPSADFQLLSGTPSAFRSSSHATRSFCPACGTQLAFVDDATPGETGVTVGSLDDPAAVAPRDHTFTSDKLPWVVLADGLPQYRRNRADG
jgi:hypothetical protein